MDETLNFKFWVPLSKASKSKDGKARIIEGIASTPDLDLQNEKVNQRGINFDYFLKHGYFNWDHKPGADNKIGEPWECRITPKGLFVKGMIYKNKRVSDAVWEHITALGQNSDSKRKVGFSLQGKTVLREGSNIAKCWVQDIAVTTAPINYNTYIDIVKSLSAYNFDKSLGTGAGIILSPEDLRGEGGKAIGDEDGLSDVAWAGSDKNKKKITKKSLSNIITRKLGYSRRTSNLLSDVLFDLSR